MAWNYDGLPNSLTRDAIRFLVGQVSSADAVLLSDEEIAYAVAETNGTSLAAAFCARAMAAQYAAAPTDLRVGQTSETYGDRAARYQERAIQLERDASDAVSPSIGGISIADKQSQQADSDWNQPSFALGMTDYPGTGQTMSTST